MTLYEPRISHYKYCGLNVIGNNIYYLCTSACTLCHLITLCMIGNNDITIMVLDPENVD